MSSIHFNTIKIIISCFFFLSFSACQSDDTTLPTPTDFADKYYVSPTGNDNNNGSLDAPWKTLTKAGNSVQAGDSIFVREGIYTEKFQPIFSGTETQPIVYINYPNETPTIDGSAIRLPNYIIGLVTIYQVQHIEFNGFTVQNVGNRKNNCGILVEDAQFITIKNCKTYNTTSSGIGVWDSENILIADNDIELACNNGEQECLTVANTAHFEVRNNHVHNGGPGTIGGEGIDVKDGSTYGLVEHNHVHDINALGIYADAWDKYTHHITINANKVHHCKGDGITIASENGGLLEEILVTNNLIYDNHFSGITIVNDGIGNQHPISGIKIINNTIFKNGSSEWGGGIHTDNPTATDVLIQNNIVSKNHHFQISLEVLDLSPFTVDFNLIDEFKNFQFELKGTNALEGNPNFKDPILFDFQLENNSIAIDAGTLTLAPEKDFFQVLRPQGNGIDIGAYEKY